MRKIGELFATNSSQIEIGILDNIYADAVQGVKPFWQMGLETTDEVERLKYFTWHLHEKPDSVDSYNQRAKAFN